MQPDLVVSTLLIVYTMIYLLCTTNITSLKIEFDLYVRRASIRLEAGWTCADCTKFRTGLGTELR